VIGRSLEHDFDAADADDRGDDTDVERLRLQHDPLLDVQLKKCLNVVAPRRREAIRIAADAAQRFAKPLASRFGQTEHPGVERADHAAAANARQAVFARLFREKVDDLDGVSEPRVGIGQRPHDLEARREARNPVESPTRRHGVAVRSDRDDAARRVCAVEPSDEVAGGVDAHGEACVGKPLGEPGPTLEKQGAERATGVGTLGVRDLGERHHVAPEATGIEM
jgi:hypothetical protein